MVISKLLGELAISFFIIATYDSSSWISAQLMYGQFMIFASIFVSFLALVMGFSFYWCAMIAAALLEVVTWIAGVHLAVLYPFDLTFPFFIVHICEIYFFTNAFIICCAICVLLKSRYDAVAALAKPIYSKTKSNLKKTLNFENCLLHDSNLPGLIYEFVRPIKYDFSLNGQNPFQLSKNTIHNISIVPGFENYGKFQFNLSSTLPWFKLKRQLIFFQVSLHVSENESYLWFEIPNSPKIGWHPDEDSRLCEVKFQRIIEKCSIDFCVTDNALSASIRVNGGFEDAEDSGETIWDGELPIVNDVLQINETFTQRLLAEGIQVSLKAWTQNIFGESRIHPGSLLQNN
jgi:hypothetical protein